MRNKKIILGVAMAAIILLAVIVILRGNEDSWMCQKGGWIKHGNPSAQMPSTKCGQ